MSLRTALGRVRGLGAAREGVHHWWAQRLTAVALVPLSLWFVASVIAMANADHTAMTEWVGSPLIASLLILLVFATFYHAYLGLQVVIEDYLHHEGLKIISLLLVKGACILFGMVGILSVLILLFES